MDHPTTPSSSPSKTKPVYCQETTGNKPPSECNGPIRPVVPNPGGQGDTLPVQINWDLN